MSAFPDSWSRADRERIEADAARVAETWGQNKVSPPREDHLTAAIAKLRQHDTGTSHPAAIVPHRSTVTDGPIRPPLTKRE